jgi:DNA-binding CsgD family transcriptional regulator
LPGKRSRFFVPALVKTLGAVGTPSYLGTLVDFVGLLTPHDRVTVTRYSTRAPPEFLAHRNFSDKLAARYLEHYYPYDPFYAYWCHQQKPGVVPLRRFNNREFKQGLYIAEFLYQSAICDELGILLDDGPCITLAVFLERSLKRFSGRDIERMERAFPSIAAVHALHRRLDASRLHIPTSVKTPPKPVYRPSRDLPPDLWGELTTRERDIIDLILAGYPSSSIADRLGISPGTVRIHKQSIYAKLDITTEREIFLQYIDFMAIRHS